MKHTILIIFILSIAISSCQVKKKVINISPNLGNPLTLSKDSNYCVDTYNKSKEELLIKQKLKNKLNVLGINVVDDCELKIVIEIKMIKGVTSKEIPIYTSHSDNKKTNSNETRRTWNEVETTNYTENYKGIFLFIDLYNKDNILLDSVNSFSDLSNREINRKKVYEFKDRGVALSMYNIDKSIVDFARACFNYGLNLNWPVFLSTKNDLCHSS